MKFRNLFLVLLFACASFAQVTSADVEYALTKNAVKVDPVPEVVTRIDKSLKAFASWGLNPDKVVFADFDFQFAVAKADCPHPKVCPGPRLYVIVKHKQTKRAQVFDVDYVARFGAYPAAVDMVELAKKVED